MSATVVELLRFYCTCRVDSKASSTGVRLGVAQPTVLVDGDVSVSPRVPQSSTYKTPSMSSALFLLRIRNGECAPILSSINTDIPCKNITVIFGPSGSGVRTCGAGRVVSCTYYHQASLPPGIQEIYPDGRTPGLPRSHGRLC